MVRAGAGAGERSMLLPAVRCEAARLPCAGDGDTDADAKRALVLRAWTGVPEALMVLLPTFLS